jgi:hypothetical protein
MKVKPTGPIRGAVYQPHVVIPYNYIDHEFARKLTGELRLGGVTPWIDDVDMSAGVFLISRISHAVRPVDFLIPVISAASVESHWVQHELKTAMTREFIGRHVGVLPAKVDGTALPDFLAARPCIDFHGRGWERAYGDLRTIVRRHTGPKPPAVPTTGFRLPRPARLT